ncbi:MAG TPA: FAD-dependent oxidoreductase [Acidobacteriaceae bacterium]|jgi:glycine oxidase|nr:FAD-dependent oxidoreductase [Acidobacteriaceae bacterium]
MQDRTAVIAGAGIIGLTTALELADAGWRVTVFDQREAMSEASRAAAGMLAGRDPENPPALRALAQLSLSLYPAFLARIEALSGRKVPLRTSRTVQAGAHRPAGIAPLAAADLRALAPEIDPGSLEFFLLEEASFDAWDLAEALPAAIRAAGADLQEHTPVLRVSPGKSSVHVETAQGSLSAAVFLNATGAWAPALDPSLPVFPRKGHMLTVELPGDVQTGCVLRTDAVYIVPRGLQRYTIGSTVEDAGFDRTVDPGRLQGLFAKAASLWPPLRESRIVESWIGFRPASEDGLPILDTTAEHCWVATGHFRNGIMLGPATGRVLAQCMTGRAPEIDLTPFHARRFAPASLSS